MKVAIVDYGMGNLRSIASALKYINVRDIIISSNEKELSKSDKLILPGVGSFRSAMKLIKDRGLDATLNELIIQQEKPVLGICLGMQLLGLSSNENGDNKGLGFVDATVDSFDKDKNLLIPHIGYNQITTHSESKLYYNMEEELDFYFVHSYKMTTSKNIKQSFCHYGEDFVASFEQENIAGTQFHPELSQKNGLQVLKNFVELF